MATTTEQPPKTESDAPPRPRRQPPYHVMLMDDDDHTYAYVIEMLRRLFGHGEQKAFRVAKDVDLRGRAILLTTTREHAELKRDQIHAFGPDWRLERSAGSMSCRLTPAEWASPPPAMATASSIWDVHHHWVNEAGYIERLLRAMDARGIERVGMIAMGDFVPEIFILHGPQVGTADNQALSRLCREHPDRFWGWGFIRLGRHHVDDVARIADLGLSGLKFHAPMRPYSNPDYFPVYEAAQRLQLPCLFHTGFFYPPSPLPGEGIRSENYRPIHLEPIAHEFPDLRMIAAHLGVCWHEEAATICRMHRNVYTDLSGRVDGWRSSKSAAWFRQILYWPEAHRKILFGTDVHADEIGDAIDDYHRILEGMGWNAAQVADVMGENAKRLFDF